ncbi:hypothetical protein DFH11DRAFT_1541767 [Phellopilus nigrolimitatus]|nr:hypothetical protein DFH11DRAFT_1541767 [Phellopilus nigrolimitatus]
MNELVVQTNDHKPTFSTFGPRVSWSTNPSLLRSIFSFNDRGDNARCARVCKGWKNPALDLVWEQQNSLRPLFCLLPCIVLAKTAMGVELKVIRPVEHTDWDRFIAYADKVKILSLSKSLNEKGRLEITDAALLELVMFRPFVTFLPRLLKFRLDVDELQLVWLRFSRLFLRDGLQSLAIRMPTDKTSKSHAALFLRDVASLSPRLMSFCLYPSPMAMELKPEVAKLLSHLDGLETLELPRYYISQDIVNQIALIPHLQAFSEVGDDYTSDISMPRLYNPEGHDRNAFTKLKKLHIHGSLGYSSRLLRVFNVSGSVTYIVINLVEYRNLGYTGKTGKKGSRESIFEGSSEGSSTSKEPLEGLIKLLYEVCPRIRSLEISCDDYRPAPGVARAQPPPPPPRWDDSPSNHPLPVITKQTLQPLGRLRCLELVKIMYDQQAVLSDDDLLEILPSLSSIKSFHLICDAGNQSRPSLTLAVLARLAQVCAMSLEDLTLHVDATQIPERANTNPTPFAVLRRLSLTGSPIRSPADVALYLSQLIPPSCELAAESASHLGAQSDMPARDDEWAVVRGYLQFGRRVRSVDLDAIRALQLQNADLQARLASLSSGESI